MAFFVVRIELHDAGYADYTLLHALMEKKGFERIITGKNGTSQLPNGEYATGLNLTVAQIRDLATDAAKVTGKRYEVLALEIVNWASQGLRSAFAARLGVPRR